MAGNDKYLFLQLAFCLTGNSEAFALMLIQRTVLDCRYPYNIFLVYHIYTYFLLFGIIGHKL